MPSSLDSGKVVGQDCHRITADARTFFARARPGEGRMTTPHRILIVNDDGIHADGIKLLERIARRYSDDVWVVAPDEEKSGASHSISMHVPVRA
ncbi:MAG: 5'/3'-nucleotidase SurE, partial [Gemmobacter sp.]